MHSVALELVLTCCHSDSSFLTIRDTMRVSRHFGSIGGSRRQLQGELPASCPCEAVRAEAGQTGAGPQGVQGGAERLVWWAWM